MYQNPNKDANRLKVYDEYLATGQTIPQNTNANGDEGFKELSGTLGGLEVLFSAKTTVTLGSNATFTAHLEDSADGVNGIADIPGASVVKSAGAGGSIYTAGTILARIPIPSNAKRYVRCNIATNDAAATGTVDAFVDFMPK